MNEKLKEAVIKVKEVQKFYGHYKFNELDLLLDLAESVLAVSGMPGKKNIVLDVPDEKHCVVLNKEDWHAIGFDESIDLCTLLIAKDYVKKEEVENIVCWMIEESIITISRGRELLKIQYMEEMREVYNGYARKNRPS